MFSWISLGVAGIIYFGIPATNKYPKSGSDVEKIYSQELGFPYQYFEGEVLTEEEVHYRLRLIYILVMFGFYTGSSFLPVAAVMLPPPVVHRIVPSNIASIKIPNKTKMESIAVIAKRSDKITFSASQRKQFNDLAVKWKSGSMSMEEAIVQLRGGTGLTDVAGAIAVVIFINWLESLSGAKSFTAVPLPQMDPVGWVQGRYKPKSGPISPSSAFKLPTTLEINKPTAMPHQEFVGLTKEEKRALPHSNDMKIIHQGRPELDVEFWQSKFKVGDHGAVHGLPYTVKAKGGTKTDKTDDNALKMMRSIVDMPNRDNVKWIKDGTYQGGTDREFEAIHIYDLDKKVIGVFKKSTGKFVTICQLDRDELLETGNFGGGICWFSGQVKNLPPQQTAVNTFEIDVTGITPISQMDENSSPNPGFTPTSSFESDVMGITPIDTSQFDNP